MKDTIYAEPSATTVKLYQLLPQAVKAIYNLNLINMLNQLNHLHIYI